MTRAISATNITETQKSHIIPVTFVRLDFASGVVRFNTSPKPLTYNAETYLGTGDIIKLSPLKETNETQALAVQLSVSGLNATTLTTALTEDYQGRDARIYLGFLDSDQALVDDPVLMFRGRMDTMPVLLDKESVINLNIQSRLSDFFRPRIRRFNNQDQQDRYPSDKGLEFIEKTVGAEFVWKE